MAVFKIRSPEIFPVGFIQISAGQIVGTEISDAIFRKLSIDGIYLR